MKIQLLPSNVSLPYELQSLTTFLINDEVAIDGGSLGFSLGLEKQHRVHSVIVTHSHSDHMASLPVFIAEAFPFLTEPVYIYSTAQTIRCLRDHVFNDEVWPDFHQIKLLNGKGSGLHYVEIDPGKPFEVKDLRITPVWVNHTVPTIGLAIEDANSAVIFTSDTYYTEDLWKLANQIEELKAIFADVSYPNAMEDLAEDSKHYTPAALKNELGKLHRKVPVYAVHLKPQFRKKVAKELQDPQYPDIHVVEIGREYVF
jgi:cAMP phosphodiesterase